MNSKVEYANIRSRLILGHHYKRQFVVPQDPPPKLLERFLTWYERHVLDVHTSGITIDRPIFFFFFPRSGTTILQDTLCSHPTVAYITNSMHQFRTCLCAAEDIRKRLNLNFRGERYLHDGIIIEPGSPNEGHAFFAEWCHLDPYSLEYVELRFDQFATEEIEEARETIRKIIWSFGSDGRRFVNKNPAVLGQILLLKDVFPDAKIIHLIRDARMCANSMIKLYRRNKAQEITLKSLLPNQYNHDGFFVPYPRLPRLAEYLEKFGPEDIRTTANLWNDAISFLNDRKDHLPYFYEVRYEDILADPQEEVLKILQFCELPVDQDHNSLFWKMVEKIKPVAVKDEYQNFDLVESICRANMQKYGYL